MTPNTIILLMAPLLLAALLTSEKNGRTGYKIVFKFLLSSLFILLAAIQTAKHPAYAGAVTIGLTLCLVGDVGLAVPGLMAFRVGLVAFRLVIHISLLVYALHACLHENAGSFLDA